MKTTILVCTALLAGCATLPKSVPEKLESVVDERGVFLASPVPSRGRLFSAGFSSADAQSATGWTYTGAQSLATSDAAVLTNQVIYLDGNSRTQGFSFNGSAIRVLGNVPLTPASDQSISLGSPSIRWSVFYVQDIQKILGTGTGYSRPQGTISTDTTAVGNVGASGPDVLQTFTLPASSIVVTGRGFKVKAWGTTANNANAKTVSLTFGSATLITKQLTASIAGRWTIEAYCIRTGASAQDCYAEAINSGGTTVAATDGATVMRLDAFGAQTQTETGTLAVATGSTVTTATNDIVSEGLVIEGL